MGGRSAGRGRKSEEAADLEMNPPKIAESWVRYQIDQIPPLVGEMKMHAQGSVYAISFTSSLGIGKLIFTIIVIAIHVTWISIPSVSGYTR